jgi:polar amino acid transport system substrate-binding protein
LSAASFSQEIIRVSNLDIAPAGFIEDGVPQGIFHDIAKQVIIEAGFIPEIQLLPYPRVLENLTTGKADMSILISNEVIEKACDALVPISIVQSIVVGLKGSEYKDLTSLHGKTVGILRKAKYDERFEKNNHIKKYQFNSYEQGIQMLFSNRFDAMAGTKISLYYTLARLDYARKFLGKPLVLNSKTISIQYSKNSIHPKAKHKIKMAAKRLIQQGQIERIIERYMGKI